MIREDTRKLALNNDTGLLKLLACVTMFMDHTGKMLFSNAYRISVTGKYAFLLPGSNILRAFGRLALPLFAYCMAVGCARTRNIWKYLLRIFIMAVLVHPLYQTAMGHVSMLTFDWRHCFWKVNKIYEYFYSSNLNILFTLSLAVLIIALYRQGWYAPMALACLLVWYLNGRIDYGFKGVVLVILFYAFLDRPFAALCAVFPFMLWWAMPGFASGRTYASTQIYAIAALIPIFIPMRKRLIKLPKWVFYAFYPGHLLAIYIVLLCRMQH